MSRQVAVRRNRNRNWSRDVLPHIKQELERFYQLGIIPTLRSVFYVLSSKNIIQNTQSDYNYLSEYTAKCRKRDKILGRLLTGMESAKEKGEEYYNWIGNNEFKILNSHGLLTVYVRHRHRHLDAPIIYYEDDTKWEKHATKYILKLDEILPIDCFADETRGVIKDFIDDYKTPERYIKDKLDFLSNLADNYKDLIPKWHNQEYHLELWTEKNAMVGTFRSILQDLDVRIVYNRGFDSMSHAWRTYQRISKAWEQGKKVRILYCGDLDPSGDMMDETIKDIMNVFFDVEKFESRGDYSFKRFAVLYEHIEKFSLPKNPDPKVLVKLKDDPRRLRFMKKYNLYKNGHYDEDGCSEIDRNKKGHYDEDQLFQIEIDALAAFNPEALKEILLNEINEYYDKTVYDNLVSDKKHSSEHISLHVKKYVQGFLDQENIKSFMESAF